MFASQSFGTHVRTGRNVFSWRPKVSVIIPAYNVAEFIGEALESVKAQKFRDHEIIVINDGSPDTAALERELRVHLQDIIYIKQPNHGAGVARNTGIKHSRGELIAFLDGDDIWLPEFLASQIAFLGSGYDMVYCDAMQFGMRSVLRRTYMETAPSEGEVTAAALLDFRCNVITSGTVATRFSLERAGLFEPQRAKAQDFHLWVRMAKSGARIGYQRTPMLKYRVHLDSLSGDAVNRVEREIDVFRRLERTVKLNREESAIVQRRLAGLEADRLIALGKGHLVNKDFESAYAAFSEANMLRRSLKMTMIVWCARFAPRLLLSHYRSRRRDEIPFIPTDLAPRKTS